MLSRKLLGLIISAAALAASAAPAGAATPRTPQPHADHIIGVLIGLDAQPPPTTSSSLASTQTGRGSEVALASHTTPASDGLLLELQMPGASTWGSFASYVGAGNDGLLVSIVTGM
jgi:hypothetical protein